MLITTLPEADLAVTRVMQQATAIKRTINEWLALDITAVNGDMLVSAGAALRGMGAILLQARDVAGIRTNAQLRVNAAYDIVAEINSVLAAMRAVVDQIRSLVADTDGTLRSQSMTAEGNRVAKTYTSAQLNSILQKLRDLDALLG